ncbi:class I SAM-dependent methyltransferase [Candidatus Gottesmanbacteria bacterium]|nr:class I SAM-dependent methyltransferase [Candidatus Gottesmanbacteria bacterium]
MYKYSNKNAEIYSKLGIEGTTYEPGFAKAKKMFGNLSGKKVLDFGSGSGRTAKLLLSFGAKEVIGVDHNQSMIDQANKQDTKNAKFFLIDNKIPFDKNTFDAAFCAHVMVEVNSFKKIEQIISEIYRKVISKLLISY